MENFMELCKRAESKTNNRETEILKIYSKLETNLTLIGATALEDRL
jgi:hypothetical protein